jgi:hypothetical protein
MSEVNPYDKYLDGRALDVILAATPGQVDALLKKMGEAKTSAAPAPGKWSPAEIVCHLADCELVFAFRLRQTLAEDSPVIQPFDQEKWAATYAGIGAEEALGVWSALRGWNLRLIKEVMPRSADRPVTHPERGTMTFRTIIETMAGHDINHLRQLERIAG